MTIGGRVLAYISKVDNKGPGAYQPRDNPKSYTTDEETKTMISVLLVTTTIGNWVRS